VFKQKINVQKRDKEKAERGINKKLLPVEIRWAFPLLAYG
jgi:hypothetical protein